LLILMLAVLGVSTLAAALLAPPPEREQEETTTEEPAPSGELRDAGRLIETHMSVSARRPDTVRVRPGDQLSLTVRSRTGGQIEVPAFGLVEDVGRADPARFDLLAERKGVFEVRLVGSGRVIGRIAVGRMDANGSSADKSRRN
jgi:hypothetical protein